VIESRTCFLPMITPASHFLTKLYRHYKAGVLPYAGGLLEQPAYYAEAMDILAGIEARLAAELAERQRAELGHPSYH
jgi:hypothetical protein